ncbi:DUF6443 domain-containing protein [Mucilaginibacter lutimaris]|uniref:DUF6443 domain-containing protein n=1 Tax=Mucilaginibacter lutimaris TaxID=931629 RepID=A0ABW2ZIZ7_9SPHI
MLLAGGCIARGARAQYISSPAVLNSAVSAGAYYNESGITLSPGFTFTATANQSLQLYITDGSCKPLSVVASSDKNYILTSVPRVPGIKTEGALANRSTCELMQTVQYMDGLGRPVQTVVVKGSSDALKDLIQPVAYDYFGRETYKFQPFASAVAASGSYRADALQQQLSYYNNGAGGSQQPNGVVNNAKPFSVSVYEQSALNRVTEQGAPGEAWQPYDAAIANSGHTVKQVLAVNNITALTDTANTLLAARYVISAIDGVSQARTLVRDDKYGASQLYVTISRDENWRSGKGGTSEEYTDKSGNVVLKRTFNKNGAVMEILSTYYVYDDQGYLAFVLPPKSDADNASVISQGTLDNLCYQYRYDDRGRLTQKKLPGRGWEYMVYNKLDQVVATQDAVQRNKTTPEWTITRYDAMGRVVMSGLYPYGSSGADTRSVVQTQADGFTALWEAPTGSAAGNGYTAVTFPATVSTTLRVNYYDNYSFAGTNPYPYAGASALTKGLPTGTLVNVLGTGNMLLSVMYYDDQGRNIKTFSQHYLGGTVHGSNYDEISTAYSFTDEVLTVSRRHFTVASGSVTPALVVANRFTYDHTGRKISSYQQTGTVSAPEVLIARNDYNDIGQLRTKHLHSTNSGSSFLQDVDYAYNERGWLSRINDPAIAPATTRLFSEQLNYNTPQYGASAQYNGNIAEQGYKVYGSLSAGLQTVSYAYDQLNRLKEGNSSSGFSETGISYDQAGNIHTLNRLTAPDAANLVYSYNGNQLTAVTKGGAAFRSYGYDVNGNATSDGQGNTISYNMLNLPQSIPGKNLSYTYDATGNKLRKVSSGTTTEYIGGIQYSGAGIDFVQTEEGRAIRSGTNYNYEYTLTDHLGNNRVTFDQTSGKVGEEDYYPFGLNVHRYINAGNKYLYNKKELQEELSQYDYGARFYDPVIARFTSIDPVAEHFPWMTSYQYASNDPVKNIDLDGLEGIPFSFFFENTAITPKIGPVAEIAGKYSVENISKAGGEFSGKTLESFRRGNAAEAEQLSKNGLEKNNAPIKLPDPKTGKDGVSVPDAFKNDGQSTVEIKNVKGQSLTKQLRLQEKYSNDNGFKPELIINEGAKISKPLQNSTFDINTYKSMPVVMPADNTRVIPTPIVPPKPPPPPPCPTCT